MGYINMPSIKDNLTQTRIATLLSNDDRLTTFVELSLDASQIDLGVATLGRRFNKINGL